MSDQPNEKLKQAVKTALAEAKRLDLQVLTHILMMAQLELESHDSDAMEADKRREPGAAPSPSVD